MTRVNQFIPAERNMFKLNLHRMTWNEKLQFFSFILFLIILTILIIGQQKNLADVNDIFKPLIWVVFAVLIISRFIAPYFDKESIQGVTNEKIELTDSHIVFKGEKYQFDEIDFKEFTLTDYVGKPHKLIVTYGQSNQSNGSRNYIRFNQAGKEYDLQIQIESNEDFKNLIELSTSLLRRGVLSNDSVEKTYQAILLSKQLDSGNVFRTEFEKTTANNG